MENIRHSSPSDSPTAKQPEKVVLVGNPNVGKSLIFNFLSGSYVDVSNFPGTTVSISTATYKQFKILDTPGVYGISSFNDEEIVARDVILQADRIINVVNALHLERDLFLTRQLIDAGKKITVLLNFSDELKRRNIAIDHEKLSKILGVPVIPTSAINKKGFDRLDEAIEKACVGFRNPELQKLIDPLAAKTHSNAEALLILEGDEDIATKHGIPCGTPDEREIIYIERRNAVNQIMSDVEFEDSNKGKFFNFLGRISLHPATGVPLLLVILTILYFFIGDFVAQRVVGFTEGYLGNYLFEYHLKSFVGNNAGFNAEVTLIDEHDEEIGTKVYAFPSGLNADFNLAKEFKYQSRLPNSSTHFEFHNPYVKLFVGEFGVISMTVTYLVFLLLPLVVAFYLVMAVLEDSGYLPRLATMMDKSLSYLGLNGRAVIPIMLGFGCVTMANITTRILGSEREKTIAIAILQFVIPCSAQLAVIAVLMSSAGFGPFVLYSVVIFSVLIILSTILNKTLPGESTPLLIDLPIMRMPRIDNILKKTLFRSYGFMKEAGSWFFIGALLVGVLDITGLLAAFSNFLSPLTTGWLKLPAEASSAFIMGTVRRDFGAAGLFEMALSPMQKTVSLIVITLFTPCIASAMVMVKERGFKEGAIIWVGTWIVAFLVGGIIAQIFI